MSNGQGTKADPPGGCGAATGADATTTEVGQAAGLREAAVAGRIVPGMTFQQRVWALTARVPAGRVTTYAAIAEALGGRAYRAVGQALHRNPWAPDVPCHRVVGSTGSLTGFASGVSRKAKLLIAEGVACTGDRVGPGPVFMSATELRRAGDARSPEPNDRGNGAR